MAIYTRTTTIDSGPTGDSVKQAVLDLDTDLTGIVAAYDVHDVATTSVHGFTGTKTGSGAMVGANTPTLITPVLGVASATSVNKVTLTAPATGSTLTVADGKTLTASATMTLTGTDATQLSLAGNLTTSGAYATTITTTNTTGVTLPISGTLVSSVTTGNGVSATNTAGALAFALGAITPSTVNGITLTGGTNTFSAAVGSASLDVAAGATVDVNANLTVESASTVNQDLTTDASPTFAAIKLTTGAGANKILTSDADGDATWETAVGTYATLAETITGTEAAKSISPSVLTTSGNRANINNLKLAVNATANILDVFSRSGGADPDSTNSVAVAIPDDNGNVMRTRAAAYLSGTSAIAMADATDYWGRVAGGMINRSTVTPTALSDTYVKQTRTIVGTCQVYYPFDNTKSLTETHDTSWVQDSVTNSRIHVDVGTAKAIDRIYYENYHSSGLETNRGAKNFTLWGSDNAAAFADTTYATDTNWTQIGGSLQFDQHSEADVAEPKYIYVPNTTAYRYYAFKIADVWGDDGFMGIRRLNLQQTLPANAYLYAIWDGTGITWALAGYAGFTKVPTTTTVGDADYFLLETSSTYTRTATHSCVCVGKIRYKYNTADTPDHTILATLENAPQIVWNPKSDYSGKATLATTVSDSAVLPDVSRANAVIKQTGLYLVNADVNGGCTGGDDALYVRIKSGSSLYAGATERKQAYAHGNAFDDSVTKVSLTDVIYLANGDTLHVGASIDGNDTRAIYGDDNFLGGTGICFTRID